MYSSLMVFKNRFSVFIFSFLVLLFSSSLVYGQWDLVNPPSVSSKWSLEGVHFTSSTEGWAVGHDTENTRGVLLHYSGGIWTSVTPPTVSPDWAVWGVYFTSSTEGWAVGADNTNARGVLLHYSGGTWTSVNPPSVSDNWDLWGVHFTSSTEGWAVGGDYTNLTNLSGVLLHYSGDTWTSVTPPSVSDNWVVWWVHFTSSTEGWAVGTDYTNARGVLLHYSGDTWTSVTPPSASANWELWGVHLTSPTEGWAVGPDHTNLSGVLLHYSGDTWTSVTPPSVSDNWGLSGVYLTSPTEGWAVGYDSENEIGVLLHFSGGTWTSVTLPSFHFGWLVLGVHFTSPTEGWAVGDGQYLLNAWGVLLRYSLEPPSITLQSPSDGQIFNSCSLTTGHQPTFTWTPNGTFTKMTILFSHSSTDFTAPIVKGSIQPTKNNWIPPIGTWKKVMVSSNNNGGIQNIYWKVVGAMNDKTSWESEVWNISIDNPVPPQIQSPGDGDKFPSGTPPTFIVDTNCNTKLELDISPVGDFSDPKKIKKFTITIKDPNLTPTAQKTLSSSQWKAVNTLIGTATGYFRVRAWDAIKRETASEIRSFTIQ